MLLLTRRPVCPKKAPGCLNQASVVLWMLSDLALRSLRLDRLIGSIAADLWPGQRDGIGSRSGSQDLKNGRRMGGSGQTRGSRLLPGQSGSQCVSLGIGHWALGKEKCFLESRHQKGQGTKYFSPKGAVIRI